MPDFFPTKNRNIVLGELGACGVQVFGPRPWDDAEFDEFIDLLIARAAVNYRRLSITFGAATSVTAVQRRRFGERLKSGAPHARPHVAFLTASATVRLTANTLGTALRMVGHPMPMASFRPNDLAGVLRWANVDDDIGALADFIRSLASEVGHRPEVIASIA